MNSNEKSKFANYMEQVDSELKESNYSSDDIASLINCREIIDGHLEYLRNLSVNYYEASKIEEAKYSMNKKQGQYLLNFNSNLKEGLSYYNNLFYNLKDQFKDSRSTILKSLEEYKLILIDLEGEISKLSITF